MGYIDTLLSFQISRAKFSYFVILSASLFGRLRVKITATFITSAVLFSLSMNTVIIIIIIIIIIIRMMIMMMMIIIIKLRALEC